MANSLRDMNYKKAKEAMEARHPGESQTDYHARLMARCEEMAKTIRKGVLRLDVVQQVEVMTAFPK